MAIKTRITELLGIEHPIVQGGMGVGISAHRLAGAVARSGALGTISSVDLRHLHPDLLERARQCTDKAELDRDNKDKQAHNDVADRDDSDQDHDGDDGDDDDDDSSEDEEDDSTPLLRRLVFPSSSSSSSSPSPRSSSPRS